MSDEFDVRMTGSDLVLEALYRVVPRARLGGQTTTNVLVSALVSDCTNVLAKCRVYFRRFCYLNQVDFADLSGTIAEN